MPNLRPRASSSKCRAGCIACLPPPVGGRVLKVSKLQDRRGGNCANKPLPVQGRRSARKGPKSLPTAPQRIRRPRSTSSSRCPHAVQPERQSTAILRIAAATKKTAASARSARSCGPPLQTPSTDTVACSPDSEQSQKSQSGVFPVPASITGAIRLKLRQDRDYVHQKNPEVPVSVIKKRSALIAGLEPETKQPATQRQKFNNCSPPTLPCQPVEIPEALSDVAYLPWSEVSSLPAVFEADFEEDPEPIVLGQGTFGRVEARMWKFNTPHWLAENPHVAVKLPRKGCQGLALAQAELIREAHIGAQMPIHHNLIKPLALLYADPARQYLAGIVYPLIEGGDLWRLMSYHHRLGSVFTQIDRKAAIQGCVKALATMHAANVAHLDVKPENLLLDLYQEEDLMCNDDLEAGDIKLGDYGMARPLQPDEWVQGWHGTPGYRPPEQVLDGISSHKSDIWAVGMVAAGLVCPALQNHLDAAIKACGSERGFYMSSGTSGEDLPSGLDDLIEAYVEPACEDDPEWTCLIRACLQPLAACRPTAAQLEHWLTVDWGVPDPWAACNM